MSQAKNSLNGRGIPRKGRYHAQLVEGVKARLRAACANRQSP
jgi:hypothetical protein